MVVFLVIEVHGNGVGTTAVVASAKSSHVLVSLDVKDR